MATVSALFAMLIKPALVESAVSARAWVRRVASGRVWLSMENQLEGFAQCRNCLQKEQLLFPARRQSEVYSIINEYLPTTLGAKIAFLQRSQLVSALRISSVILACLALSACVDETSETLRADLQTIAGVDQDESGDASDSGAANDTDDDSQQPSISSITVADGNHSIGAEVTITLIAAGAESGLSLRSGSTFNTQQLANFTAVNGQAGHYTAIYTVTSGDPDVAIGGLAEASIALVNSAGAASAAKSSVRLNDSTGIDANAPAISAISVAVGTHIVGAEVEITISAANAESNLSLAGGSTFNGQELISLDSAASGVGNYLATYIVTEGDLDITDGSSVSTDIALVDAFGNLSAAEQSLTLFGASIDANSPTISDLSVAGDNSIDASDDLTSIVVSGNTSGVEDGQELTLRIGEAIIAYADLINGDSEANASSASFSVTFDLSTLSDGTYPVIADVADSAGNPAQSSVDVFIDARVPSIAGLIVAGDNQVNASEAANPVAAVGTISDFEPDQQVSLYIEETLESDPITAQASVDAAGTFTVDLNLSSLADGGYTVIADAYDSAGNLERFIGSLIIDTAVPEISSVVVAANNIVNAAEVSAAEIAGDTSGVEDGQLVRLNIDGIEANATVNADSFSTSIDLSSIADGATLSLTADTTDSAGNAAPQVSVTDIIKDTVAPEIALGSVAGDDVIDGSEVTAVVIIGSTTGVEDGQTVSLAATDGNNTLEAKATVNADSFSATLDLSQLADSSGISVSAHVADSAGNQASTTEEGIVKDTLAPAISITAIAEDDIINSLEASAAEVVGNTSNVEDGQIVSLSITDGNTTIETTTGISANSFSVTLDLSSLVDSSSISATANVADVSGNPAAPASKTAIIKDTVAPEIVLSSVAEDGIFNAAEMESVAIVGSTVGAADGQVVSLSVSDGVTTATTTTSVSADAFSTTIDLSALADSISISALADVADVAGNPAPQASFGNIVKDTVAPEILLTGVADDDIINAAEVASAIITGSTTGVADGQIVALTATDGTAIIDANTTVSADSFSTSIDLSALAESISISVSADVADVASNAAAQARRGSLVKDTISPEISITSVAGDGVISASEAAAVVIVGATSGAENGQVVSLAMTAGSITFEINASVTDDSFSATLDLSSVADGTSLSLTADVADLAGNPALQARIDDLIKNTAAPVISSVIVAGDDFINATEVTAVDISGTTSGVEAGQQVSLSIGGLLTTALVDSSGAFNTTIDLSALSDSSSISLTADVEDAAGNSASQFSKSVMKDSTPPTITAVFVSEDNLIGNIDIFSAIVVSGSSTGAEPGQSVALTLGVADNAVLAEAPVDASGAFSVSVDLSAFTNGTYALSANLADLAGNPAPEFTGSFDIEVVLPTQVVIAASISLSVDTGSSAIDFITGQAQQTISAELNATLDPDDSLYASVDSGGNWHQIFTESNLSGATNFSWDATLVEGDNAIQFFVADVYDKRGSITEQNYTLDTAPPEQNISAIELSDDTGISASDLITNISAQTLSASLSPGLEEGDTLYGSIDSGANWEDISATISASNVITWAGLELLTGSHYLILRITDIADNNSSFEREYILDQTLPVVITIGTDTSADELSFATFDSSSSTDSGGIASHSWQQVQSNGSALVGDALPISGADSAIAQVATPAIADDGIAALSFYFATTVTDNAGNSATSNPATLEVNNTYLTPAISLITPILATESGGSSYFDQVGLSWDANSSLSYYLYRSSSATCTISSYSLCPDSMRYISGVDFAISNSSASVIDSGLELATTYYYWLEAQIDSEVVSINAPPLAVTTAVPALNDTGLSAGGDFPIGLDNHNGAGNSCDGGYLLDANGVLIEDPNNHVGTSTFVGFVDEDCELGRDADPNLNDDSDGNAALVFTRLNSDGTEYTGSGDYSAEPWACVLDHVTGLIWEVKTDDTSWRGFSGFTWYNPNHGATDSNGNAITFYGTESDQDTQDYVDYVNGQISVDGAYVNGSLGNGLCGSTSWRLPTVQESQGFADYDVAPTLIYDASGFLTGYDPPTIDSNYFPNTTISPYQWFWTSHLNADPNVNASTSTSYYYAWLYGYALGNTRSGTGSSRGDTASSNLVRLVSSSAAVESYFGDYSDERYTDNLDGTISDARTGLMWAKCSYGQTYDGNDADLDGLICEGSQAFNDWQQAFVWAIESDANADYGYSGWRLPNAKELSSIVDFGSFKPAINQSIFPNTANCPYWSSTPSRANLFQAIIVGFQAGDYGARDRNNNICLRLVRDIN